MKDLLTSSLDAPGRALETVRRQLQHEGSELKGSLWSLRGNAWNLSAERQKQRRDLCAQYTNLGRAKTAFRWRRNWPRFHNRHSWSSLRECPAVPPTPSGWVRSIIC